MCHNQYYIHLVPSPQMRLLKATVSCSSFNAVIPLLQKRVCHGHNLAGVIDNVVDDIIRDKTPIGGAGHCEAWDCSRWTSWRGLQDWFILEENLPSTTGLSSRSALEVFQCGNFACRSFVLFLLLWWGQMPCFIHMPLFCLLHKPFLLTRGIF